MSQDTWSSPNGLQSLQIILRSLLPEWPNGPHDWQIEATARILDHRKQLVVAACGEGKTAVAYLHLLVIQELLRKPELPRYGLDLPDGYKPVVLMVTPLSDLGKSQVCCVHSLINKAFTPCAQVKEMARHNIRAIALDAEHLKHAYK